MARRFSAPYQSEPVSGLANGARNLAVFSVIAVVVSILIVRFGFLEMKPALATFFGALGCAALSILIGLAGFAATGKTAPRHGAHPFARRDRCGRARLSRGISAWQYRKLPAIHDITTDPIDPPRFEALARLRARDEARRCSPPCMPVSIPPNSSGRPIPTSSRSRSKFRPERAYAGSVGAGQQAQVAGDRRASAATRRGASAVSRR